MYLCVADYIENLRSLHQQGFASLVVTPVECGKANKLAYIVANYLLQSSNENIIKSRRGLYVPICAYAARRTSRRRAATYRFHYLCFLCVVEQRTFLKRTVTTDVC